MRLHLACTDDVLGAVYVYLVRQVRLLRGGGRDDGCEMDDRVLIADRILNRIVIADIAPEDFDLAAKFARGRFTSGRTNIERANGMSLPEQLAQAGAANIAKRSRNQYSHRPYLSSARALSTRLMAL